MSRSGYSDDVDGWQLIMWRGAVASAIRGKRGQDFLREMLAALDAIHNKRLIGDELEAGGEVCAIGSVGRKRGVDMSELDPYDSVTLSGVFGISKAMVCEIAHVNDNYHETPEHRFSRVREWIVAQLALGEPDET